MRRETRALFNELRRAMAQAYGVDNVAEQFEATVPMAQSLNDAIQASDAFLNEITIIPVDDIKGEVLDMQIHSTIAGRTDTSGAGKREPQLAGAPDGRQYECKHTDFDVGILYALLDVWARYKDFRARYMAAVYRRIALDRILIGWYGESAAATTDRVANPLLQDVNFGWIYDLKTNMAEHYLTEVVAESGKINIGPAGDYKNIDQLAYDIGSLIPKEHLTGREVAIIGQGLVSYDMNKVLGAHAETPTEKVNFQILGKSYGGFKSVIIPQFPDKGLLITDPRNLQLYYQRTSLRRQSKDEPEKNRVVDYISQNEAYRVGNLKAIAGIEADNVAFVE
ncbi:MAG: phage major capsid protein, P2 family [Victivallaceae bacterium]|nr:phage major capsid protein, P2 family [Victivallaceae bacterium]